MEAIEAGVDELRPTERRLVIDLVSEAGMDVSDWANYKGAYPASNPKYCYEWAFVDPGQRVVLNLWFEEISVEDGGRIVQRLCPRHWAMELERNGNTVRARRARSLDGAFQEAFRLGLPLRVIINDGQRRDLERDPDTPSKVERRRLDNQPWHVAAYDWTSGDCLLVRGPAGPEYVDQFSLPEPPSSPQRQQRTGSEFVRSAAIRQAALTRAAGHCEFCGEKGFAMANGSIYLETHHVIPLSENGPDSINNVAALCPGHHREAHYGARRAEIRDCLIDKLQVSSGK